MKNSIMINVNASRNLTVRSGVDLEQLYTLRDALVFLKEKF